MKIVVDTNVLVSGLLSPYGPSGKIVKLLSSGVISVYYDARIISEYKEVFLRPKFSFEKERVLSFLEQLEFKGEVVSSRPLVKNLPDGDDELFLEVAIAANAKCLVTGNLKYFPKKCCEGINILSPADFLKFLKTELNRKT